VRRILAAILTWPLLVLLAVPVYCIGAAVIVRDLWRRWRAV
jgi:hypothetical protein